MSSTVNQPININMGARIACGLLVALTAATAFAQTPMTITERKMLQGRIVRTKDPEKLVMAIAEAFYDLGFPIGNNPTLFPTYLDAFKKGDTEIEFGGKTIECGSGGVTVTDPNCGQSVSLELSSLKEGDKYLIKLVVNGGKGNSGENLDSAIYKNYYDAISKSLFMEKANINLEAPTQY